MSARGSVLIVEDDPALRELYADVLRDEGWLVQEAGDGLEALDLLAVGTPPCVVVLDLRMPRMDGWELASRLRENGLPFVLVAAHYRIQEEAHSVGARWWLQKPVAIDRLLAVVAEACSSSQAA
jgi:two-component system response regulator MprA